MSEQAKKAERNALIDAARDGSLPRKIKKYLSACRPPPDADPKKESGRLPTLAGFCSMLGCGLQSAEELAREFPVEFDYLCAVLEDEALNSARSPTLINTYLKERLHYGERGDAVGADSVVQPIFEHDILEDGS